MNIPNIPPNATEINNIDDFLKDLKMSETEFRRSSKIPNVTAIVPPLSPGIIAPIPINMPLKKFKIKCDMAFKSVSPAYIQTF